MSLPERKLQKSYMGTFNKLASHADVLRGSSRVPVRGAGTRDEPLRTSAWEAINKWAPALNQNIHFDSIKRRLQCLTNAVRFFSKHWGDAAFLMLRGIVFQKSVNSSKFDGAKSYLAHKRSNCIMNETKLHFDTKSFKSVRTKPG